MTLRNRSIVTTVAGLAVTTLALTSCAGGRGSDDGKPTVVASTNVWGSVAKAIGGDRVDVQPIINDPAADPHSYETTPRDAATISDADLLVYNGGGYDEFIDQVLGAGEGHPQTVQAFRSEHDPDANEHVWYDLPAVDDVASRITDELSQLRPGQSAAFHRSADRFHQRIGELLRRTQDIAARHHGQRVIATEPLAHYLIDAGRLDDITPQSFVHAVEDESDPPAESVAQIQDAVRSGRASAVIYNPQTESPVTRNVRAEAEQRHIPVVRMTETLPSGTDYLPWMTNQINALDSAL